MNTELMERSLPKWPQMIVTGTPVSEMQALEIIRRTDVFFATFSLDDKQLAAEIMSAIGVPDRPDFTKDMPNRIEAIRAYAEKLDCWRNAWGVIRSRYVYNNWIDGSHALGFNGWCHPDGRIGYAYNIGAWPYVQSVYHDWVMIAREFPFLELEVTLMNDEWCEDASKPVVSMLIRDGKVELVDPNTRNLHVEFGRKIWDTGFACFDFNQESMIGLQQFQEWGRQFSLKFV